MLAVTQLTKRMLTYWHPVLQSIGSTALTPVTITEVLPVDGQDSTIIVGHVGSRQVGIQLTVTNTVLLTVGFVINHAHEIEWLRDSATIVEKGETEHETRQAIAMRAVAALLEVHDDTGLNLTKFGDVEPFVNMVLSDYGFEPVANNGA
jgi:hypothetical protein